MQASATACFFKSPYIRYSYLGWSSSWSTQTTEKGKWAHSKRCLIFPPFPSHLQCPALALGKLKLQRAGKSSWEGACINVQLMHLNTLSAFFWIHSLSGYLSSTQDLLVGRIYSPFIERSPPSPKGKKPKEELSARREMGAVPVCN